MRKKISGCSIKLQFFITHVLKQNFLTFRIFKQIDHLHFKHFLNVTLITSFFFLLKDIYDSELVNHQKEN